MSRGVGQHRNVGKGWISPAEVDGCGSPQVRPPGAPVWTGAYISNSWEQIKSDFWVKVEKLTNWKD